MEQIGTLLQTDEGVRLAVVAALTYLIVEGVKLIAKWRGHPVQNEDRVRVAVWALVVAAVGTVLQSLSSADWSPLAVPWAAVVVRIIAAWWAAMGANSAKKRLEDLTI